MHCICEKKEKTSYEEKTQLKNRTFHLFSLWKTACSLKKYSVNDI